MMVEVGVAPRLGHRRPPRQRQRPGPRPGVANRPRPPKSSTMHKLQGIAVSPGIAIGPVRVLDPRGLRPPPRAVSADGILAEFDRLDRALELARDDARAAELEARRRIGPRTVKVRR